MKLAMRLPEKYGRAANDSDPRDGAPAEVIDLASRTAYPVVGQRKGRSDAVTLAAGVGFVALLGAATLLGLDSARMDEAQPAVAAAPARPAVAPLVAPAQGDPAALVAPDTGAPGDPAPAPVLAAAPNYAPLAAPNPFASPTLLTDNYALPAPAAAAPAAAATAPAAATGGGSASDFASRIGGVGGAPAQARGDVDPQTTLTQGTMIPAVLETAINTDVPGYVRAVVSQDVRSFDGSRILVPRSSRLIGQYQSGLQAGQKRAYVIWTRLIRPDGVSVALASPGTAFDGSGGLPGKVDNHFFERFGSSMLLSVIGGLSAVASGVPSVFVGSGQGAASPALEQAGQIGPTIRVRMGEPIRVFTARDLDFSQAPRL
ncbi:MAG TPA: TrbI/VirB10 family protein [Croceibacterium sp.]|nr:TrbI/VirB10 family protein [Croceibacterium sp.]